MKLELPPLEEPLSLASGADASVHPRAPFPRAPIYWPSPPYGSYPGPSEHLGPMECMIQGPNGRVARAVLLSINFEERYAELQYSPAQTPVALRFGQFLSLTLAEPLSPSGQRAGVEPQEVLAVFEARPRLPYRVVFNDARSIAGKTIGYVEKHDGLFLFPPIDDTDRVIRTFLPMEACQSRELGTPIGKVLARQRATSSKKIEQVAAMQEELRSQKVGEILVKQQIVTAEDLLKALELQASRPVMRVGEALIALGLIRPEQLDAVLELQKNDRSAPLGELLIRQNLITREDLRTALARKMGYPIVDIGRFPVDINALQRIPYAIAQRLRVLPLVLNDTSLVVGVEDVTRHAVLDELEFVAQTKVVPALVCGDDIEQALVAAYARAGSKNSEPGGNDVRLGGEEGDAIDVGSLAKTLERDGLEAPSLSEEKVIEQSDNSLVRLINQMIIEAHVEGASDIHIECCPGRDKVKVRFRRDGRLRPYIELPHNYRNALISRIKIMCDLDISERRKPQDGKINFARYSPQHKIELRVATIPTDQRARGHRDAAAGIGQADPAGQAGTCPKNLDLLKLMVRRPYGLVLCVGPTGSGKTTTLHSALGHINQPERKIWTAEDPVEITQPGLRQVQVNPKIDWTFARALRAFLRADPDVIMVGRDPRPGNRAHRDRSIA